MKSSGNKLKIFIQKNYKLLFFITFFFIINITFAVIACVSNEIALSSKRFVVTIITTTIVNLALCFFILFSKQKSWPIEKIFLLIGSVLGIMYLLVIPIGRAPDEPSHIWRVYSIAQGDILTQTQGDTIGNSLPENIAKLGNNYTEGAYNKLADRFSEPISENQVFKSTIGSNPIDYLPQIIGMVIGRVLNLPAIIVLYLARFFGLISCIGIIYLCLKYIPILKKPLFFISCLPLTMQTFISISYDGAIFCSAIALITFILYSIYQPKFKMKLPHYIIVTLLCVLLTSAKPVYFPIILLLFFIPVRCLKSKKKKVLSIILILLITIGIFLLWSSMSIVTQPGNGANTNGQILFILSNPFRFFSILVHNILDMPITYFQRLGSLEWLDVYTNEFYIIGTIIFFTILCIEQYYLKSKAKPSNTFRWATLIAFVITTVLIFTALYIQWTQVGAYNIEGVQTRYLLPIFILIPLFCISSKAHQHNYLKTEIIPMKYFYTFIIFLNCDAINIILCSHF